MARRRRRRLARGSAVEVAGQRVDNVPVRPTPASWQTSGHDAPVFVDESGRRAQRVNLAGVAMALLCACWLATLVLGMSGFTTVPGSHLPGVARVLVAHRRVLDLDRAAKTTEFAGEYGGSRGLDAYASLTGARSLSCGFNRPQSTPAGMGGGGARSRSASARPHRLTVKAGCRT